MAVTAARYVLKAPDVAGQQARTFLRRAASTLRPPGVAMRARKPLTRARFLQSGSSRDGGRPASTHSAARVNVGQPGDLDVRLAVLRRSRSAAPKLPSAIFAVLQLAAEANECRPCQRAPG